MPNKPIDAEAAAKHIIDGIQDDTAEQRLFDALLDADCPNTAAKFAQIAKDKGVIVSPEK